MAWPMSGKAVSLFLIWCSQVVTLVMVRSMVAGYVEDSIEYDMLRDLCGGGSSSRPTVTLQTGISLY